MKRKLPFFLTLLLFLIYTSLYADVLSHIIFYHEQHHLFLFSSQYFQHQIETAGWMSYFTDFVIQFFYYPWAGCALLGGMLASIYGLCHLNIRLVTGRDDLLQLSLIPSLYLFLQTLSADYSLVPVVSCFIGLLALAFANFWMRPLWRRLHVRFPSGSISPRIYRILTPAVLTVYAAAAFYLFVHSYNMAEYRMLKAEQAVKEKNWEEALAQTSQYLDRRPNNALIFYFRHLALYHEGKLLDHLFDYPQRLGVKGLYFPWNSDSRESEYGHFLYEDLGYINEAQRWEFEAMVVWGETAPHLLNLARYNIVNHRPQVALKFIRLLQQSLFYREEADKLEAVLYTGEVEGLRNALSGVETVPARFANVMNIGPELLFLCEQDPQNRMAFEYLMCDLLLSNQVVRFVEHLPLMERFDYPAMPAIFEEALLMYKLGVGEERFAATGFAISSQTEQRFARYYELFQQKDNYRLRQEFGKTYWYYLNFISPYGNKIITN